MLQFFVIKNLTELFCQVHSLGYKDSNLEMTESESVALPFGDSPIHITLGIIHEKNSFGKYIFQRILNKNVGTPHSPRTPPASLQLSGLSELNQVPLISRIWDLWGLKAARQGSGQSSDSWVPTRHGLCALRWSLHSAQLRPS